MHKTFTRVQTSVCILRWLPVAFRPWSILISTDHVSEKRFKVVVFGWAAKWLEKRMSYGSSRIVVATRIVKIEYDESPFERFWSRSVAWETCQPAAIRTYSFHSHRADTTKQESRAERMGCSEKHQCLYDIVLSWWVSREVRSWNTPHRIVRLISLMFQIRRKRGFVGLFWDGKQEVKLARHVQRAFLSAHVLCPLKVTFIK